MKKLKTEIGGVFKMSIHLLQKGRIGVVLAASVLIIIPAKAQDNVKKGAEVYEGTCIACHGENGKGEFPGVPDFTSSKGPLAKTDTVLLDHIIDGFQSPGSDMEMPALGGNEELKKQDIINVLAYIRKTFKVKK
ncbi:c-type cytochrome [Paremcibacter congregatus]|uniref:c-type cytochrome n=1 Tax=Paremcibacter congregatus TaxID=2043170 RepID=UPI0030EDF02E|tara:strand:- start:8446 stop:8847 length:402 start_codon:yes stop_codon:yes gene_type:complete